MGKDAIWRSLSIHAAVDEMVIHIDVKDIFFVVDDGPRKCNAAHIVKQDHQVVLVHKEARFILHYILWHRPELGL